MLTVISLVVALSIMVLVHEFGHLLAAKLSHVVVEEFGIGYPPRVWTFWRSQGKIQLEGKQITIPRRFPLPREIRAGSSVLYETTTDNKGRHLLSRIQQVDVDDPEIGSASPVQLLDRGTLYSVNAIPFGGFTKMLGEEDPTHPGSLASKRKLTRLFVLVAGGGMNLLTAVLFFALALSLGAPVAAEPENAVVSSVSPGSPAESSGLLPGDIIVAADDTEIPTITRLQEYTQDHLGVEVVLTVDRDGQSLEVTVIPRTDPPQGQAPIGIVLSPRTTIKRYPWYEAIWTGLKDTIGLTGFVLSVPIKIIQGLIPAEQARPVGPVGVGQLMSDAVQYSVSSGWWYPALQMMGVLSVAIAVTNLLPLPALDGGRILFVIVEAIRGRRIDPAKEGLVHLVGMLVLLALMLLVTWQDVVNPVPNLDWSSYF